ncbi:hypothetical protein SLEP1_g52292 [Rubroshorea leprosula]|uniref:F-box associated beta-propeller type 3 domain-containing protein n=1 Tax=Rubroshorea leprosula TaxID=152421 RepID=A0AAV5M600_9ROSI|nr:hypothetical protein SLEP1_g52292 [Rubroshorea leprosula]
MNFYCADFDDDLISAFLLNNPLKSPHWGAMLCASYFGLILLSFSHNNLILWNPFTRRYKRLPLCPIQTLSGFRKFVNFGLGYDSALDDYKVVMISEFYDSNVYQTWGALYWECDYKFVGFDLTNEVFFDLPPFLGWNSKYSCYDYYDVLVVSGGHLHTSLMHDERNTTEYYLFVSDKSGEVASGSWRKEFTLEYVDWLLVYSKEGDKILLSKGNKIFWYNLEDKTRQRAVMAFPVIPKSCWIGSGILGVLMHNYHVCCESLVSPGNDAAFDGAP